MGGVKQPDDFSNPNVPSPPVASANEMANHLTGAKSKYK